MEFDLTLKLVNFKASLIPTTHEIQIPAATHNRLFFILHDRLITWRSRFRLVLSTTVGGSWKNSIVFLQYHGVI
jgi:hypothetical protein